jgi:hypothetical protein
VGFSKLQLVPQKKQESNNDATTLLRKLEKVRLLCVTVLGFSQFQISLSV